MDNDNYVITGGFGHVGSSLVKYLNSKGIKNIIIIENPALNNFSNAYDLQYRALCFSKEEYFSASYGNLNRRENSNSYFVDLGCDSSTNQVQSQDKYKENIDCSYFEAPFKRKIFISSAAVYGNNGTPNNFYAFCKLQKENLVKDSSIILRPCNIYGPREGTKSEQNRSPIYNFLTNKDGNIVFYSKEKKVSRDFIYVNDVCEIIFKLLQSDIKTGVFDLGTGESNTFEYVAQLVQRITKTPYFLKEKDFPATYQYFTQAKRNLPFDYNFTTLEEGVRNTAKELGLVR